MAGTWLHDLRRTDRDTAILVGQAVTALLEEGPSLGRPLVDRIKAPRLHNLKELRPAVLGHGERRHLPAGQGGVGYPRSARWRVQ